MARILIVDDESAVRDVLEKILRHGGHDTVSVGHGLVALRELSKTPFDLMIADIVMPDMSGIKLIDEARSACPSLKILAISGGGPHYNSETCVTLAREHGADGVMMKPLLADKLIALTAKLLAMPRR
jgi:CheY-like chemotaxis protein